MRAAARTCAAVVAVAASLVHARQNPPAIELKAYYSFIKEYRQGHANSAIAALLAFPAIGTRPIVTGSKPGFSVIDMNAAALLETEAGFQKGELTELATRLSHADLWLDRARRQLAAARENTRPQDEFRCQWVNTLGRRAIWNGHIGIADRTLLDCLIQFPDDVQLNLTQGLVQETAAFSVDRVAVASLQPNRLETALLVPSAQRTDALVTARLAFERVIARDQNSAEAHLRLAHVLIGLNDDRRAIPHLEQARMLEGVPAYRYLAAIMLGDVRRRAGDVAGAIELYRSARALMPNTQSAYIAQAHALRMVDRADDATAVLRDMLNRTTHEDDPWVFYPRGLEVSLTQFDRLRAQVREK